MEQPKSVEDIDNITYTIVDVNGEPHNVVYLEDVLKYASQQTAALRERHREESVTLIRNIRSQYQQEIAALREENNLLHQAMVSAEQRGIDKAKEELEIAKAFINDLKVDIESYKLTIDIEKEETRLAQVRIVEQEEALATLKDRVLSLDRTLKINADEAQALWEKDQAVIKQLQEALKNAISVIERLIASKPVVSLDETLAYYKTLIPKDEKET